ncbi:hypothetical protein AYO22_08018 [Fonsecaea multimorphosa]|nr:hypothetical protein AYO22_08018 [Fonsecaea multimorphosa]
MSSLELSTLLGERSALKQTADNIAEKFAKSPDRPFASIHPALQPQQTHSPVSAGVDPANGGALVPVSSAAVIAVTPTGNTVVAKGRDAIKDNGANQSALAINTNSGEALFKNAMREYEASVKKKYRTGINPDDKHSMDQLWAVIDEAIDHYETEATKGFWGKIRLSFRKLGENGKAIEGWLGLLPSESEYMSVVCGGLKLLIKAAARMRDVADKVLDGLHQIPAVLNGTQRVLNIFRDDKELRGYSETLYCALLAALGHMLEYLKRKSLRKLLPAVLKQETYESGLVQKIGAVEKARDNFNQHAQTCHMEAMKKLAEVNCENSNMIQGQLQNISNILVQCEAEKKRVNAALEDAIKLANMSYNQLLKEFREIREPLKELMKLLKSNPAVEDLAERMHIDITDRRLDAPEAPPGYGIVRRASMLQARSKIAAAKRNRQKLLSRLDYDPDITGADVVSNYILGSDLSREDEERSLFVIKSQLLADWVEAEDSVALLVNGNAKRADRKSALSFVCARLVYALDQIRSPPAGSSKVDAPGLVPIHFFCGRHDTGDESWESPAGIVNSLLAQLLTQCKDVSLARAAKLGDFDSGDIKEVFARFKAVLNELPAGTTVFCVIDAISFYIDKNKTEGDAKWLVVKLLRLARRSPPTNAVFKLLLTAPTWLRMPDLDLEKGEILSVRTPLPNTGGFSAMKWDLGVGRRLEELNESDD